MKFTDYLRLWLICYFSIIMAGCFLFTLAMICYMTYTVLLDHPWLRVAVAVSAFLATVFALVWMQVTKGSP